MIILFNKPYKVLSQFTREIPKHITLKDFGFPENVYPIGRLDYDSEGMLLLGDEKQIVDKLLNPKNKHERTYHVQVDGEIDDESIAKLESGVLIQGYKTLPTKVKVLDRNNHPERIPPVRYRANIPTSWIEIKLIEGKNHQIRRMTANVGFPTLRLIRVAIGNLELGGLLSGKWKELNEVQIKQIFL